MAQWIKESGIVTAVVQFTAVAQVQSLAWELMYIVGTARKRKKQRKDEKKERTEEKKRTRKRKRGKKEN